MMRYTDTFGFQWLRHAKTQLDSHNGTTQSRDRLFATTGWPADMSGQKILEAGSGSGRFTEVLLRTGAEVWSFDDSEAVEANRANNGGHPRLRLFQANIFDLRLGAKFDKVICLGVLQHTPDPRGAFLRLADQLVPGGEIVVDVYAKRLTGLLHWKYVLRPVTKRMPHAMLYRVVNFYVPLLLPLARVMRHLFGEAGARLIPVKDYSHIGLPPSLAVEWAILDTFDCLSPWHDNPQRAKSVREWFAQAGLTDVHVAPGANGIVAKGRRPLPPAR